MMLKLIPVVLLIAAVQGRSAGDNADDLSSKLDQIFGSDPNKNTASSTTEQTQEFFDKIEAIFSRKPTDKESTTGNTDDTDTKGKPCVLNGKSGICVPYYLCPRLETVIGDSGVLDIPAPSDCDNYIDTCCDSDLFKNHSDQLDESGLIDIH